MIQVRRGTDRYVIRHDGIESLHCFAAGGHYDPDNVAFGPLVGVDEHRLAPGAGFARHGHRGVIIISWVLAGRLRHEEPSGRIAIVEPGQPFVQDATLPIEHTERNDSAGEALHFVQTTWLAAGGRPAFGVYRRCDGELLPAVSLCHLFVARGSYTVSGHDLVEGDSLRVSNQVLRATGAGELLVVSVES